MTGLQHETTEALLGELIAVLAQAYQEAEERKPRNLPPRRPVTTEMVMTAARREMIPVAVRLARAVASGNRKSTYALLDRPRTRGEWKSLALVLAAAADPERIGVTASPAPVAPGRGELRRAS